MLMPKSQLPPCTPRPYERKGPARQHRDLRRSRPPGHRALLGSLRTDRGARIAMTRYTKRGGQVWIKIFPDKPVTQKPAETRMGSGKGSPEYWVAVVKPGRVLFEMAGVSEETAREAMRLAGHKLPCKTKFVLRGAESETGGEKDEGK